MPFGRLIEYMIVNCVCDLPPLDSFSQNKTPIARILGACGPLEAIRRKLAKAFPRDVHRGEPPCRGRSIDTRDVGIAVGDVHLENCRWTIFHKPEGDRPPSRQSGFMQAKILRKVATSLKNEEWAHIRGAAGSLLLAVELTP
jgi:hypothetical protein